MSKKKCMLFACAAMAGLVWSAQAAGTVDLTVLQSTDLHGSPAVAKYAKWIAAERASDPELLLVDCGDLCNGTFATWIDGGASMVSYLNLCQYDVWVPGNHEFRIGNENFKKDLSLFTAGSVLAANVIVDDPARKPSVPILPWKLFTKKGVRIAVIGMASHRSDDWYDVKPYRGLRLLSPVQALKEVMPAVRAAKPDIIAVAMHSDLSQGAETETGNENWVDAKEIYAAYPEIVLFFEGHTHRAVPATEISPGRWIVQPRDNGGSMAKVRVSFDTASRKVTRVTSEFVEAKKLSATDDAHMPEVWRKNNAAAEIAAKTPIVHLPDEYVWRAKEKKGGLPPTLVAEAMRAAAGSDAAIVCQGGQLRPTTADLTAKFFFGLQKSGFSVLTLDPDQLKKALAASGKIEGRSVGIDPENLPTKPITVAFDAYDLAGCDGERMGLRELARSGVPRREVEINLREAVRAYMTKRWPAASGAAERVFGPGTHYPAETQVFTAADSGTVCKAAPGARPVISGARKVTGWRKAEDGLWCADVPWVTGRENGFRQLTVGGALRPRAKHPNKDCVVEFEIHNSTTLQACVDCSMMRPVAFDRDHSRAETDRTLIS